MLNESTRYYVPPPSTWPICGSFALLSMAMGAAAWFNGGSWGRFFVFGGLLLLAYMIAGWFSTVAHESETGMYNKQVDTGFRWGMGWFIFSEVMFFGAFFGALFYMRVLTVPDLGSLESQQLIWQGYKPTWPTAGPGITEQFTPMGAMGIPALNTLILLTSGATVTWAHWGLLKNNRSQLIWGLVLTVALGIMFIGFQAYEYIHAASELNLKLSSGAYGSTFYMLTGFHGFHVTIGTIMLIVILARSIAGHFTAEHDFGFVGVAWYWHFVDVVWLLLFVLVYWL